MIFFKAVIVYIFVLENKNKIETIIFLWKRVLFTFMYFKVKQK